MISFPIFIDKLGELLESMSSNDRPKQVQGNLSIIHVRVMAMWLYNNNDVTFTNFRIKFFDVFTPKMSLNHPGTASWTVKDKGEAREDNKMHFYCSFFYESLEKREALMEPTSTIVFFLTFYSFFFASLSVFPYLEKRIFC